MADAMRPPMGGGAPAMPGARPGAGGPDRSSMMNPNDVAMKAAAGRVRPDMTVRELLAEQGIDVDGPISQLAPAMRGQMQNATTAGKLQGGPGAGRGPRPPRTGGAPALGGGMPSQPAGSGLDQLLRSR